MNARLSEDMEDLGNEALVFIYGRNVNLYQDVFNIAYTCSNQDIQLTHAGVLKELELAKNAFGDYKNQNDAQRHHAMRLGMKESHFALGVHPPDFIDIKMDAVKRAYEILSDKKSRQEYDNCLREHLGGFGNSHEGLGRASNHTSDFSDNSNDGDNSPHDAPVMQAQGDSDFPLLSSFHHHDEIFDPFNLKDNSSRRQDLIATKDAVVSTQDTLAVPVSPDCIDSAFSASFTGMQQYGQEVSMHICALSASDSDESVVESEYESQNKRKISPESKADIYLPTHISIEEEDELVSFKALSKNNSDANKKQSTFVNKIDEDLDDVDCFSDDNSEYEEQDDTDYMSVTSLTKENGFDEQREDQQVWICLGAILDEVSDTLDDTVVTIEQMCGVER